MNIIAFIEEAKEKYGCDYTLKESLFIFLLVFFIAALCLATILSVIFAFSNIWFLIPALLLSVAASVLSAVLFYIDPF